MPIPAITPWSVSSESTPQIFLPSISTSFGHFTPASFPVIVESALATQLPTNSGTSPCSTFLVGSSSTDSDIDVPGSETQDLSRRPLPAVCSAATTAKRSGFADVVISLASSRLVESTLSRNTSDASTASDFSRFTTKRYRKAENCRFSRRMVNLFVESMQEMAKYQQ